MSTPWRSKQAPMTDAKQIFCPQLILPKTTFETNYTFIYYLLQIIMIINRIHFSPASLLALDGRGDEAGETLAPLRGGARGGIGDYVGNVVCKTRPLSRSLIRRITHKL